MEDERRPDLDELADDAVEARVRQMMDPSIKDVPKPPSIANVGLPEPGTAPEIEGMPLAKGPLKIKILDHDDDKAQPKRTSSKPVPAGKDTPEPEATPAPDSTEDDEKTNQAVDDIIASESDQLLKAEDKEVLEAFRPEEKPQGGRIKRFFRAWWHNPRARWATIIVLLLAIAAAVAVPRSRYFVLNTAGVRASLSVHVLDESTFQPLKNVEVSAAGASALTDADGRVKLDQLRLGSTELVVDKRAFAPITQQITIGWGSNPQHDTRLKPVGAQYVFNVTDFLSGKGIKKVEAISGDASAVADEKGQLKLTIEDPADQLEIIFKGEGYREEKITLNANTKDETPLRLVPARKQAFVSKRSGTFDVYKVDIDGKNEEKILPGTGSERENMVLIMHPAKEIAALVSTREGKRNKDGYLLGTLTLINLVDNATTEVAASERVQLIDWIGDRIVYVQVAAGTSAANSKRHRLMSYDYEKNDNKELAASNYFNDVITAAGKLYYAPSGAYQNGVNVSLFRVDADGANRQIILAKEVWNLFRTSYDGLTLSAVSDWYDYRLGGKQPTKLGGEPATPASRVYVDSPDRTKSLWADTRDGKGVLIAYDIESKQDKTLHTQSGLKNPIRWLDNHTVIFRIHTDQETADYALSLDGGQPQKIRDVTNIGGIDQWYYY